MSPAWIRRGADLGTPARPDGFARTAPTPALAALRENLSQLASRTNVAPAYAEDLAAATAFYDAHSGPLVWVTERGISERGNRVIAEIRKADDWGLQARDFSSIVGRESVPGDSRGRRRVMAVPGFFGRCRVRRDPRPWRRQYSLRRDRGSPRARRARALPSRRRRSVSHRR